MAGHMKGPWNISALDPRHVDTRGGQMCIDCTKSGPSKAVDAANAKLVAAAPDLLAALKSVAHRTELGTALFHKLTEEHAEAALAAIAKAEGKQP